MTPPRIRPGQPVSIYPGLALKWAQTNEGMMPSRIIIDTSSKIILLPGGFLGSLGAIGLGSLISLLTSLASFGTLASDGRYLGVALLRTHCLHISKLGPSARNGLPSQTFPQYDDEIRS